jgi:hypothetical protein
VWRFGKRLKELRERHVSPILERRPQDIEEQPYLYDTILFLPEVFELRDAESDEAKAKRPFGLKELFAGLVELGLRFDPAIEGFGPCKHLVCIELVLQRDGPAGPPSSFHVIFELTRDVLELLQDLIFLRSGPECSIWALENVIICMGGAKPFRSDALLLFPRPRLDNIGCDTQVYSKH